MKDMLRSATLSSTDRVKATAQANAHGPPMGPPDPTRHPYGGRSALAKLLAAIQPRT